MTIEKRNFFKKTVGLIIAVLAIVSLVVPIYIYTAPVYHEDDIYDMDAGWHVEAHGQTYDDVVLSTKQFDMFNRGDVLTLTQVLPENLQISNPVLQVYSVHSVVEVYLDEQQIYSYGRDFYDKNELAGYGYNYGNLPSDYAGKNLKIVFTITENNAFEGIPGVQLQNGATGLRIMLSEQRISLLITGFLVLFGIIGMLLSLIMIFRNQAFAKTFCITAFSFLVGAWTFCNGDLMTLFVENLRVKVFLEYISFYLMTLPFFGYFYDNFQEKSIPKILRGYYYLIMGIDVIFFIVVITLQATNTVHFPVFVSMQHIIIICAMVVVLAAAINDAKMKNTLFTPFGFGFAMAIFIAAIELVRFNLNKYIIGFPDNKYNSRMQFAALVIVITLLLDFCDKVTKHLYKEAQTALLRKLAYVDELTELANRRKCEDVMDNLENQYAVVSLDMNSLKAINDTYGHEVGDQALCDFAKCLRKAFPEKATVGRMGGDEFIAIVPEADRSETDSYVAKMNQLLAEYNQNSEQVFTLSAAWGVEVGAAKEDAREVYGKADKKMYECKRLMKKTLQYNQ